MSSIRIVTAVDGENPTVGDLQLVLGQLQWVGMDQTDPADQADMVAQRVRQRLLLVRGEWYLDQREGFPWREFVLGKAGVIAGPEKLRSLFKAAIEDVPGVREVTLCTVAIDRAARTVAVEASFVTTDGAIVDVAGLDKPWIVRTA